MSFDPCGRFKTMGFWQVGSLAGKYFVLVEINYFLAISVILVAFGHSSMFYWANGRNLAHFILKHIFVREPCFFLIQPCALSVLRSVNYTQWLSENKFARETSISFAMFESFWRRNEILLAGSRVLFVCRHLYFTKTKNLYFAWFRFTLHVSLTQSLNDS